MSSEDTITEKLNSLFDAEDTRTLVFWYDAKMEYSMKIQDFAIGNAEILVLTKNNYYHTKHLVELEQPTKNFLIYAAFAQPPDAENPLADMVHYSTLFSADTVSLILQELGYPRSAQRSIEATRKFWNEKKRMEAFKKLHITNPEDIELGILSVLTKTENRQFCDIVSKVILEPGENNNPYLDEFHKYGVDTAFWTLCEKKFNFTGKSLQNLIRTLFVTDMYQSIGISEEQYPKKYLPYTVRNWENSVNVIREIRQNKNKHEKYEKLAAQYELDLNPETAFGSEIPIDAYLKCDTFEWFNKLIIGYLRDYLVNNKEPYPDTYRNHQRDKYSFWKDTYGPAYRMLEMASEMIAMLNSVSEYPSQSKELIEAYTKTFYKIDSYYRWFYEAYEAFSSRDDYEPLRQFIEQRYRSYLEQISSSWSSAVEKTTIPALPIPKQYEFYNRYVKPEKVRTVVIISDALRYETAVELADEINGYQKNNARYRYQADIKSMLSMIPSKTELGMAALLPHTSLEISLNETGFQVTTDGNPVDSTNHRNQQLQRNNAHSMAITVTDLMNISSKEELKECIGDHTILYVYHNGIDAIGDKMPTEHKVFDACRKTIQEIISLITKLTNYCNISNYIITADHGFIYMRDRVPEDAKISVPKGVDLDDTYKRFVFTRQPKEPLIGTITIPMTYVNSSQTDLYVMVPRSIDLFRSSGGGLQYTHGGMSMQETIVPVITVKTKQGKTVMDPAGLVLLSPPKLTAMNGYLDFMQKLPVSDSVRSFDARIYFVDGSGTKISNEIMVSADGKPELKSFHERFTLHNRDYSRTEEYWLVIEDVSMEKEYEKYSFTIDIAFKPLF